MWLYLFISAAVTSVTESYFVGVVAFIGLSISNLFYSHALSVNSSATQKTPIIEIAMFWNIVNAVITGFISHAQNPQAGGNSTYLVFAIGCALLSVLFFRLWTGGG